MAFSGLSSISVAPPKKLKYLSNPDDPMFQGIVEQKGKVLLKTGARLVIRALKPWKAKRGESVAVNGICLTVSENSASALRFDLGHETMKITNLRTLRSGNWVNLERPIRLGDPIHGHLVLGHAEMTGKVKKNNSVFAVSLPSRARS